MRVVLVTFACLATLAAATLTFEAPSFDLTGCLKAAGTYDRMTCSICQEATRNVCSTADCGPVDGDDITPDCTLCYDITMVSAKSVQRAVYDDCKMCGVVVEVTNNMAKAKDAEAVELTVTKECSQFCTIESCISEPEDFAFAQAGALVCQKGVRAACGKLSAAEAVVA